MPTKKEVENVAEGLTYKGKPLLRKGSLIYYGNPDDKYIISMIIQETSKVIDLEISSSVLVQLQTNVIPGQEKIIKKAERDGLFGALDLGHFWLEEALGENS